MVSKTKICTKCNKEKPLDEFYGNKNSPDGLMYFCKKCDNDRAYARKRKNTRERGGQIKISTLDARKLREDGRKYCPGCKEIKSVIEFYTAGTSNSGRASHCISCSNELGRNRPKEEKHAAYVSRKDQLRDAKLKKKFGISLVEYNELFAAQNGICAICGGKDKNKTLAVDHSHSTGKVRALLCGRCNPAIGFLKDNVELAQKFVEYLEKHKE